MPGHSKLCHLIVSSIDEERTRAIMKLNCHSAKILSLSTSKNHWFEESRLKLPHVRSTHLNFNLYSCASNFMNGSEPDNVAANRNLFLIV